MKTRKKLYKKHKIWVVSTGLFLAAVSGGMLTQSYVHAATDTTANVASVATSTDNKTSEDSNDNSTLNSNSTNTNDNTNLKEKTSADTDSKVYVQPSDISAENSKSWVADTKEKAKQDYEATGQPQKIVMNDATTLKLTIGSKSIPRVDAVDISSYQSWMKQSDFNKLKSLGVKSAIVKLTESSNYTNPYAKSQISLAKNAGLNVDVYHYARFASTSAAKSEANHLISALRNFGLSKNTLIFADMEDNSTLTANVGDYLNTFWSVLSAAGYTNHGVYTFVSYAYAAQVRKTVGYARTWMAQYPYTPTASTKWNTSYGAWQFSSTAFLPGSSNPIDVSIDYTGLFLLKSYNFSSVSSTKSVDYYAILSTQNGARNDGLYLNGPYNTSISTINAASHVNTHDKWTMHVTQVKKLSNGILYAKVTDLTGKYTWWVDTRALTSINFSSVKSTTDVNYYAVMSTQNGTRNDGLYTNGPYNTSISTRSAAGHVNTHNKWTMHVTQVKKLNNGISYAKVTDLTGKYTWWVDTRSLINK